MMIDIVQFRLYRKVLNCRRRSCKAREVRTEGSNQVGLDTPNTMVHRKAIPVVRGCDKSSQVNLQSLQPARTSASAAFLSSAHQYIAHANGRRLWAHAA
jgi:hypothetical protein